MTPRYRQLADEFREQISLGRWPVGDRIPSIAALQDQYGVRSLNTVRQAEEILVTEGLLQVEQGRGAFVITRPPTGQHASALAAIGQAIALLEVARCELADSSHASGGDHV